MESGGLTIAVANPINVGEDCKAVLVLCPKVLAMLIQLVSKASIEANAHCNVVAVHQFNKGIELVLVVAETDVEV